jgi:hypothetical protein
LQNYDHSIAQISGANPGARIGLDVNQTSPVKIATDKDGLWPRLASVLRTAEGIEIVQDGVAAFEGNPPWTRIASTLPNSASWRGTKAYMRLSLLLLLTRTLEPGF